MAIRTPKNNSGSENAYWDGNKVPVNLVYDAENNTIKMVRSNKNGELITIASVENNGSTINLSGATQNNQNQLYVNTDVLEDTLNSLLKEMKKINLQLAIMTDMVLQDEDMGIGE